MSHKKSIELRERTTRAMNAAGASLAVLSPAFTPGVIMGVLESSGCSVDYAIHAPALLYGGAGLVVGASIGSLFDTLSNIILSSNNHDSEFPIGARFAAICGLAGIVAGELGAQAGRIVGYDIGSY